MSFQTPNEIQTQTQTQAQAQTASAIKSLAYVSSRCEIYLNEKGCFLTSHKFGIEDDEDEFCHKLLKRVFDTPTHTLLDQNALEYLNTRADFKNATGITRMISQFFVPSAELEMYRGNLKTVRLVESIDEPWSWSTPLDVDAIPPQLQLPSLSKVLPTPQPDYAVGFPHDAFTPVQLEKLKPYLGSDKQEQDEVFKTSAFQGTQGMLFPFLTSECKSFTGKPFVANRQNAHGMGRSLRGVVELFRLSRRQTELHRKVLGFSIYHDHRTVTINARTIWF